MKTETIKKTAAELQTHTVYLAGDVISLERGWIKCGITDREAKQRIGDTPQTTHKELYKLQYYRTTVLYLELEKHMHNHFENDREWIKATLPEAIAEMDRYLEVNGDVAPQAPKFIPREHQADAIKAIVDGSKKHNKMSLVMPTGSGKTLTDLWIGEALKVDTILFLAPSLQLIRQTKDAWVAQSNDSFKWMAVCSAKDIEEKEDREYSLDMGGLVSTDPQIIVGFMDHTIGKKVIFSTYQSLPSVLSTGIEFDLTFCDEAHRTAGVSKGSEGLFQLVHGDKMKSKLTVFQTATPRVFKDDLLEKVEAEEEVIAFDMNDEDIYGPIVYEMTLGEAIEKKMLCDYRIIAVGITDKEVAKHLQERTYVAEGLSADEAAAPFTIAKVMETTGANHMISFHSRLALADHTTEQLEELGIHSQAIKGKHSTKKREKAFQKFKKKDISVLTSAQALTEGVDIEQCDSIFFASPKASTISIIQAMGRALRLDPNNPDKLAHIIVPVYVEGDPTKEVDNTAFKGLYQLISSVCEADHRVRSYVEGLTEGKGSRGEQKPMDYIKLADFERLNFQDFTDRLRDAFIFGVLSKRAGIDSFEDKLEMYKQAMGL